LGLRDLRRPLIRKTTVYTCDDRLKPYSRMSRAVTFSSAVPKTRYRRSRATPGWEPVFVAGVRRYKWMTSQRTLEREMRRCIFTCRKQCVPKQHDHSFTLPRDQDPGFPKISAETEAIKCMDGLNRKLLEHLARVSGRLDISARKACSILMQSSIVRRFMRWVSNPLKTTPESPPQNTFLIMPMFSKPLHFKPPPRN